MNGVIKLSNIYVNYGKQNVLENINFQVNELDFIGIIGPNGAGKSTLLKTLLGLITPKSGQISIMNYPVSQGRKYIGYVPQVLEFDRAFPILVEDVVRMGRLSKSHLFKSYNRKDEEIVTHCLEQVGMIKLRNRPIGELSGGERQRVYIARALASQPSILLLDEPTANIDSKIQNNIYELLKELNEYITILLISHDLAAISTYVKTIACLNRTLHYHQDKIITSQMIQETYQCPIDLIAHGIPHRILPEHNS
ncbi:MAG: ABC transporter ATP-binding protein [Cyanobacteria bacterium]|uniref:metal ABC transporter ATP-binding protein n=1 Tax=Geminocystis sp. TaxID=2664100 RepID=UPI001D94F1FB|nr:ABC transporter ATP-binding protein [Cyanobacteria bacterium CG_2015-16_32_12]NCO78080.1 ABC transporter ATP-binding protein [Cyanobacteria bacterium CG_2015-22_32_23]NCQ05135.1 ABC transporter ATP-binding protein [Cyanobacteria bacterium CG_2015-09_32_10]NCQ41141.1 ABC transporter ATP-binding protein [Cyanobacteria bacterium CG_2015-04_32_10]NCS83833.1 ABC transporter ATP-binding protein [Cyanobacteria bacterium CG_2015-02_32_10]